MLHTIKTITATEMRGVNRSAVLEIVRTQGPISRSQIAKKLGVSLPTVMRVLNELFEEDLVCSTGNKESSGGRKRVLLDFNAHGHLVIGVDISAVRLHGAVVDLAGEILTEKYMTVKDLQGVDVYDRLKDLIAELLCSAEKTDRHIRGIGIGAPGITYFDGSEVKWAPYLDWRDFPLKEKLQDTFELPVTLDNDVNLSALGEMWFGAGKGLKNLVLLIIDQGIGAGIIIDGNIYRGSNLTAGEIGFLLPGVDALQQKWVGVGATESFAGIPGIITRAMESRYLEEPEMVDAPLTIDDVFKAYNVGTAWAQPVIEDTINQLALVVSTLSVCFDPDAIILSGKLAYYSELIIEQIRNRISGRIPILPRLVPPQLNGHAAIMGTVIKVLHNTSDIYIIQKLK